MPTQLPIYSPSSPLDLAKGAPPSSTCSACELGTFSGVLPCIPPEGSAGGWLVVTDHPTEADNATRMPLSGQAGKMVRAILARDLPDKPMAFVSAVNCATTADAVEDEHVDACRQYVKHAIELIKPRLILCLGSKAALSITGFASDPASVIGGYAFIPHHTKADRPLPVFFGPTPFNIARNRVIREQFRQLLTTINNWKWSPTHGAHFGAATLVVQSGDDALSVRARILATPQQVDAQGQGQVRATCSVDVETWYPAFQGQRVVSLALSWYEGGKIQSAVWDTEGLDPMGEALWVLNEILQDPRIDKVMHNGKFDQHALHSDPHLVAAHPYVADTRLLAKLLNPNASAALDSCAVLVGMGGHKNEARSALEAVKKDLIKYATSLTLTRTGKARPAYVPTTLDPATIPPELIKGLHDKTAEIDSWAYRWLPQDVRIRYNALDTAATIKLWVDKRGEMSPGQRMVFEEVVMPATQALVQMEEWGLPVDIGMLDLLESHIAMSFKPVKDRLDQYGTPEAPFNPGSRPQVIALLQKLKLNPRGTTASGAISVDDKSLEPLRKKHPVVNDILEYRRLVKMQSTYVDGVRSSVCADGKIHATALLDGTGTGRLSYQRPNLQNWPRAVPDPLKPEGRMLRDCVVAPPGWLIVETDQSQVEIRVAAALSGDPDMLKIINEGRDFHGATAEMVYGPEYTDEQRTAAKTCIAEGQLVLTNTGLKPIESVRLHDLVWDGMEWVRHDGVVFQGERDVIEYAGLTATPDHMVFTTEGGALPFGTAASRLEGRRLAVGGDGCVPARYAYPHGAHRAVGEGADEVPGGDMLRVPRHLCSVRIQHPAQEDHGMCLPEGGEVQQRPAGRGARGAALCDALAHQHPDLPCVPELRGARHPEQVHLTRTLRPLGSGEPPAPDLQGCPDRPDQQRRALRARQPAARNVCGEPAQLAQEQVDRVLRGADCGGGRIPGHCACVPELPARGAHGTQPCGQVVCGRHSSGWGGVRCGDGRVRRIARVYDIANAGPRSRFTVSGYVVSNCNFSLIYEIPENIGYMLSRSLTAATGREVSKQEAQDIADKIFGKYKRLRAWMHEQHMAGIAAGGSYTIWRGELARFRPLPDLGLVDDPQYKGMKDTAIRSTWNGPVQGTSSDLTTSSLWPIVSWVLSEKAPAKVVVTIHDSIVAVVREDWVDRYITKVKQVMTQHQGWLGVTLAADAKVGQRWGQMTKYKKEAT